MLELKDVTAKLKKEFPGCLPSPLQCMPEGEEFYKKEVVVYVPQEQQCGPDNSCWPDYSSCNPQGSCSPDYSYCLPD